MSDKNLTVPMVDALKTKSDLQLLLEFIRKKKDINPSICLTSNDIVKFEKSLIAAITLLRDAEDKPKPIKEYTPSDSRKVKCPSCRKIFSTRSKSSVVCPNDKYRFAVRPHLLSQ